MHSAQRAPKLVQERPLIRLLTRGALAHHAESDRELGELGVVEDAILAQVFRLHHQGSDHDELPGELVREVQLISRSLLLHLALKLLLLLQVLLVRRDPLLRLNPLQVYLRLGRGLCVDLSLLRFLLLVAALELGVGVSEPGDFDAGSILVARSARLRLVSGLAGARRDALLRS